MEAGEYLKQRLEIMACAEYQGQSNLEDLVEFWKKPWSIEFCKKYKFPIRDFFIEYQKELLKHNIFVDKRGIKLYNRDIVLVNSTATIDYSNPEKIYNILLYHNSRVVINAKHYAVVKVSKITEDNEVYKICSDGAKVIVN